jgi:hypothetical protein
MTPCPLNVVNPSARHDLYLTIRELIERHDMTPRGIRQCVTRALRQKPQ